MTMSSELIDPKTGQPFDFAKECAEASTQELLHAMTLVMSRAILMDESDVSILRSELLKRPVVPPFLAPFLASFLATTESE
jgi:hypothetical protein